MRLHRSATGAGGTGPNISTPDLTNIRQASDAAMGKQTKWVPKPWSLPREFKKLRAVHFYTILPWSCLGLILFFGFTLMWLVCVCVCFGSATVGQMAPPVSAAGLSPPGAVMGPPQGVTGGGGSARRGSLTKESIARHNKKWSWLWGEWRSDERTTPFLMLVGHEVERILFCNKLVVESQHHWHVRMIYRVLPYA